MNDQEPTPIYKILKMNVIRFKQAAPSEIGEDGETSTPYDYYIEGVFVDEYEDAFLVGEYWKAIDEYLSSGNPEKLETLSGRVVSAKGEYIYLVTDLEVIDGLFELGAFDEDEDDTPSGIYFENTPVDLWGNAEGSEEYYMPSDWDD